MGRIISSETRRELPEAVRLRYRGASKINKTRILNEFIALTGYRRKYAVRLLGRTCSTE